MNNNASTYADQYEAWKKIQYAARGQRVREALAERRLAGKPTGCAPVGFKNAVIDGEKTIIIDEVMGPLVHEAFELAATGTYSLREMRVIMTEKGLRSRNGTVMGVSGLHGMLKNPLYQRYFATPASNEGSKSHFP